jgi:hypothetical protein
MAEKQFWSCPMVTGIFAWIAAHAAEESRCPTGPISRYPGGVSRLRQLLQAEGHKVVAKGKRWVVLNYENSLVS